MDTRKKTQKSGGEGERQKYKEKGEGKEIDRKRLREERRYTEKGKGKEILLLSVHHIKHGLCTLTRLA